MSDLITYSLLTILLAALAWFIGTVAGVIITEQFEIISQIF